MCYNQIAKGLYLLSGGQLVSTVFLSIRNRHLAEWRFLLLMMNCIDIAPINDKNPAISIEIAGFLAGEEGFEPSAYGFGDRRSAN